MAFGKQVWNQSRSPFFAVLLCNTALLRAGEVPDSVGRMFLKTKKGEKKRSRLPYLLMAKLTFCKKKSHSSIIAEFIAQLSYEVRRLTVLLTRFAISDRSACLSVNMGQHGSTWSTCRRLRWLWYSSHGAISDLQSSAVPPELGSGEERLKRGGKRKKKEEKKGEELNQNY